MKNIKNMKNIVAVVIAVFLMVNIACADPDVRNTRSYQDIYQEVLSEYLQSQVFQEHLKSDKNSAIQMIMEISQDKYNEQQEVSTRDFYQYVYYVSGVELAKQSRTYNCGYYNVAMALYGIGDSNSVSGNNIHKKADTIEHHVGHYGSSILVYEARQELNHYSTRDYHYAEGKMMTLKTFKDRVRNSLKKNSPILLHARTGEFKYYGDKNVGHYITVDYYNARSGVVRLQDCNYRDQYYGSHHEPITNAFNAINKYDERYLIYD